MRSKAAVATAGPRGVTPSATHHAGLGPHATRHVKLDDMPWEKTKFPGVEAKTLYIDKSNGHVTVYLKMAPGATLPDHEHVLTEQTFVLEGRLVDKEGPEAGLECGPGEFVWRPAGSRHAAWTPEGGLMLAIFQMPNKFYEPDGSVKDMLDQDWEATWRDALWEDPT